MSKTTLPKFEDYKAPWEVDASGNDLPAEEQNLDPALLKKKLYDVLSDRQRRTEERDAAVAERDKAKGDLDAKVRETETSDQTRQREQEEALEKAKSEGSLPALKLEVALDIDGISAKDARKIANRLTGSTRDELVKDAQALVEDFGIGSNGETGGQAPVGRPRVPRAAGDPAPLEAPTGPVDAAKVNELFPRR